MTGIKTADLALAVVLAGIVHAVALTAIGLREPEPTPEPPRSCGTLAPMMNEGSSPETLNR